jgi:hypothetical protein
MHDAPFTGREARNKAQSPALTGLSHRPTIHDERHVADMRGIGRRLLVAALFTLSACAYEPTIHSDYDHAVDFPVIAASASSHGSAPIPAMAH